MVIFTPLHLSPHLSALPPFLSPLAQEDWGAETADASPAPQPSLELLTSLQEYGEGGIGSHQALVGPLPRMHQMVLLQVGELGEALLAQGTLEWALPTVHTQMDLNQVWERCCQLPSPSAGPGSSVSLYPHPHRTPF